MKSAFLSPLLLPTLALAATALAALPAGAQAQVSSGLVVAPGGTVLSLTAEGRTSRKPDLAVFNAGVASTGKTAGEALAANSADMNRVIAALKRAGIAERDIQTSQMSLNPVYADMSNQRNVDPLEQQTPRIIGYQVNNTVTVRQRELEQFGKVIDTLVSAGANQVNGPSFEMNQPDAALDEARTEAVRKARQRANLYASAAGLKVVRILSISEGGGYMPPSPVMYARAAMDSAGAPPISAGEVSLNTSVTVQFELAP
ncbi:MAG: SIMPL domain-containing protein [Novosphingobium sp.]